MRKVFIYVDMDAFFASVEQVLHPEYKGKPVIVGATDPSKGVVSTASYEARKYGVHSAMSARDAHRLCPDGIYVEPNMKEYSKFSKKIYEILSSFSPSVHMISVDEGYLDMTGMGRLYKSTREAATVIKKRIYDETGLTSSLGIAGNLILAKMASDYKKPDALTVIKEGREEEFIDTVGIKKLWGVGPVSQEKLKNSGITTTEFLRSFEKDALISRFGKSMGSYLYDIVRGKAEKTISHDVRNHSISRENTFYNATKDTKEIETLLNYIAFDLALRSLDECLIAHTLTLKLRYDSFETLSTSVRSERGFINSTTIFNEAMKLFDKAYTKWRKVRLLGLSLSGFTSEMSTSLFDDEKEYLDEEKHRKLEEEICPLLKKGLPISKGFILNKN